MKTYKEQKKHKYFKNCKNCKHMHIAYSSIGEALCTHPKTGSIGRTYINWAHVKLMKGKCPDNYEK